MRKRVVVLAVGALLFGAVNAIAEVVGEQFRPPPNVMAKGGVDGVQVRAPLQKFQRTDPWIQWIPGIVLFSPARESGMLAVPPRSFERAYRENARKP